MRTDAHGPARSLELVLSVLGLVPTPACDLPPAKTATASRERFYGTWLYDEAGNEMRMTITATSFAISGAYNDVPETSYTVLAQAGGRLELRLPTPKRTVDAALTLSDDGKTIAFRERDDPPELGASVFTRANESPQ